MMNIKEGTQLCGFTVKRVRTVNELNSEFIEMTHDKTGAELCWMNNKAQNKLFSCAFKTLPSDSTGVFHILEHSVFCGSEKYPVKDPFVYLLKSSMNTFLNAMTYPDKTVYPVSSCNETDFLNLTSVYLDAVFSPSLTKNPNVFYQEGIHTEINDDEPFYKGVVFNEMKGAMAEVNDRIEQGLNRLLFPDNCYRFNSGGDPAAIPDLKYESYVKTYYKFYHPSNARFFLDGDIPLEKTLILINSYLDKYSKNEEKFEICQQNHVSNEGTDFYEIDFEEDDSRRSILALGKIIGTWKDKTRVLAARVLCDVLCDSNESPLKRTVLSSGLADNIEMSVSDGIAQPYLTVIVRNMDDNNSDNVKKLICTAVEKIISDGLDKKTIHAAISRLHFNLKQLPEPQGLYRALTSYTSWLYGGDPLLHLTCDDAVEELCKMAENGGFERLLEELLVDKNGICTLHMLPSKTLGEEEWEAEGERLVRELNALSDEEFNGLMLQNKKLLEWQQMPDLPEAVNSLPQLDLSSVDDTPELIKTEKITERGATKLYHPIETSGIIYLSLYFPLADFTLSELSALSLFTSLFGELPTEQYSVSELEQTVKSNIGSLGFEINAFARDNQTEKCTPYLVVRAGILEENFVAAKKIIVDMLLNTKFDDIGKIKEIIIQNYDELRRMAVGDGHSLGIAAVQAHYSAKNAVNEAVSGYTAIKYMHAFADNFDNMIDEFLGVVKRVRTSAICSAGLITSVTASKNADVSDIIAALPEGAKHSYEAAYKTDLPANMGIRIPAQISFAVKGYNLAGCKRKTAGSLRVASNIISLCYLWNVIRVQNGAYGAGMPVGRDGSILCYSYRDPSPSASLEVYGTLSDFIKEFCESEESLDGYVISTVAASEPLCTPEQLGLSADEFWFSGVTDADRIETRSQILSTDKSYLLDWCPALDKMAQDGAVCIIGSDAVLADFDGITVFEL